jgi:hypothetical protein
MGGFIALPLATPAANSLAVERPLQSGRAETSQGIPACWEEGPVIDIVVDPSLSSSGALEIGALPLPLSASKPDIMTPATLAWSWVGSGAEGDPKGLIAHFAFPDPKPFGLPYSVLGYAIETPSGLWVRDWSEGCAGVGVSLFPNQQWQEQLTLDNGQFPVSSGDRVRVRVWGSRN